MLQSKCSVEQPKNIERQCDSEKECSFPWMGWKVLKENNKPKHPDNCIMILPLVMYTFGIFSMCWLTSHHVHSPSSNIQYMYPQNDDDDDNDNDE